MTVRGSPALLALILLGLCGMLVFALANGLAREVDISPIGTDAARQRDGAPAQAALPQWKGLDPAQLTVIVDAPLFIEGRRMPDDEPAPEPEVDLVPEPEELEAPPPAPVAEPDVDLVGVLIAPDRSKALVAARPSGAERWIAVGDRLGEWTVETIEHDEVRLAHEGKALSLELRDSPRAGPR